MKRISIELGGKEEEKSWNGERAEYKSHVKNWRNGVLMGSELVVVYELYSEEKLKRLASVFWEV